MHWNKGKRSKQCLFHKCKRINVGFALFTCSSLFHHFKNNPEFESAALVYYIFVNILKGAIKLFRLRFILLQIALNTLRVRRLKVQNHPPSYPEWKITSLCATNWHSEKSGKVSKIACRGWERRKQEDFAKSLYECFFVQVHIASLPSSFLSECGIVSISLQGAHRAQCVVIRTPPWEVDQKYVYGIAGMSSSRPAGQIHDRTNTKYTRI